MSTEVLDNALQGLLPSFNPPFPKELINLSNTLFSQSRTNVIGLRPDEEIARATLCCHLAIERLMDSFNFPPPSTKRAPVPPKVYHNLLNLFRNSLSKSLNKSPVKMPYPSTPTKRSSPLKRSTLPDASSPTPQTRRRKLNLDNDKKNDGGDDEKSENEADYDDYDQNITKTPSKSKRGGTPSPVKRRGLAKETDPTPKDVQQIANGLQISDKATEAVIFGYKKYNNLVKDRWGLLCGLFYVICSRVHPELLLKQRGLETLIMSYAGDKSHMNDDKMATWIIWADKILADQTWVRDITVSVKRLPIGDSSRRKHSSGIGNMITFGFTFTSKRRLRQYDEWKTSILNKIKENSNTKTT